MKTNCGTTILSIIANDGITIGADSMARHNDGHAENFSKLRVIRGAVIACEGLGMINPETAGDVPPYRADQWMAEIESSLPVELNAEIIARAIETTHPFLQLVRVEEMIRLFYDSQVHSGKGYLADFLIASAPSDRMLLLRVRAKMVLISKLDDPQWRVVFDRTVHFDRHSPIDPFVRHHAGKRAEIDKAFSGNGDGYQNMLIRTNGSFQRLIDGEEVGLDELRDIVRCAIALEAKANPEQVGPPFVVATLQPGKPVVVASYSE